MACCRIGWMGPKLAEMGKPRPFLARDPVDQDVGMIGRETMLGGSPRLTTDRTLIVVRYLVSQAAEPVHPNARVMGREV